MPGLFRACDECGGVDDHPRHSFAGTIDGMWPVNGSVRSALEANAAALVDAGKMDVAQAIAVGAAFMDTTSTDLHIDCCAARGCPLAGTPDGCDARVAVWNGRTGAGMVKAAQKVRDDNPDHFATPEEG